jgi:hypothetical protein
MDCRVWQIAFGSADDFKQSVEIQGSFRLSGIFDASIRTVEESDNAKSDSHQISKKERSHDA